MSFHDQRVFTLFSPVSGHPEPLGLTYVVVKYLYVGFNPLFGSAVQGGWAVVPRIVERAYFRRLERSHGGEAIILIGVALNLDALFL